MTEFTKLSVAMATYNGEKYLEEQLQSIARQEVLPGELVVCDDGSTDRSVEILHSFSTIAPFTVRIYRNSSNLGFSGNFLKSAGLCKGEFIAFCDQDDIWLPNKLKQAAAAVERNPGALLVLQSAVICDENLRNTGRVFPGSILPGYYGPGSQYGFWVWPGFLQTFRSSLLEGVVPGERPRSYFAGHGSITHDKLTCLLANAMGGIIVLSEPTALYRRHPDAVTGSYAVQPIRQRFDKARSVGSDHYNFLAVVASETADYLRHLARGSAPIKAKSLGEAAQVFDTIKRLYVSRACLYSSDAILDRLWRMRLIHQEGGYFGPAGISLGWRSAVKDLLCALGLLGKGNMGFFR